LTVSRILPEQGLAGAGPSPSVNRNAFVDPAVFPSRPAASDHAGVTAVTFVSNRGGVESGAALSQSVSATVRQALGPEGKRSLIETPKRDVLNAAERTGDTLGAVFLMIGSFSIIAGALLLVNIFVMLGEERKEQLGMLRAIGMRRNTLIGSLTLEGAAYSVGALIPGVLIGIGVGWAVARLAAQIFGGLSATGSTLSIRFAVTPTSLLNGAALGLLIGIVTIFFTSVRISRLNVIAAIRDLVVPPRPRARKVLTLTATCAAALLAAIAVPAVANSQAESSYLLPSLAVFLAIPALRRFVSARAAVTTTAAAVLGWCLLLPLIRPHLFDHASMASFVIEGTLLAFAGVALVSQNQDVLLKPITALGQRSAERRLAARLAVAYPLAKRFRTGATLMMYTLITLVLVLLVEVSGVLDHSIGTKVAQATASYDLRVEVNPAAGPSTVAALTAPQLRNRIAAVTPLVSAPALASDPGHRTEQPLHALAVGVNPRAVARMSFDSRLPSMPTDAAVWNLIARDPRYVAMDPFFGSTGGPNGRYFAPGDSFTVIDPRSGAHERKIIAGILTNASIFYPGVGNAAAFPFVGSGAAVRAQFGVGAVTDAALVRAQPGVSAERLAAQLQARFLADGLIATPVGPAVRRMFDANIAFFRLMQGFLALGLLVGITGLGVVMVRAVRERRRTIGVLRALGVQARTVRGAFLLESAIIAVEGVVLGSVLGVLTTWLMYRKSAMFDTVRSGFPVLWTTIIVLVVVTLLASLAATVTPARRAAAIRPALAVRIAD
jgi:putative ABC transport system permease protein